MILQNSALIQMVEPVSKHAYEIGCCSYYLELYVCCILLRLIFDGKLCCLHGVHIPH